MGRTQRFISGLPSRHQGLFFSSFFSLHTSTSPIVVKEFVFVFLFFFMYYTLFIRFCSRPYLHQGLFIFSIFFHLFFLFFSSIPRHLPIVVKEHLFLLFIIFILTYFIMFIRLIFFCYSPNTFFVLFAS